MSIYGPQKSADFPNAADYSSLISDFVSAHFPCSGCRTDFRQRIGKTRESAKLKIRDPAEIKNNDDLIIWLWKIHNDVNETLMREPGLDSTQFGDVENFPKRIWPDRNATEEEIVEILRKEYKIWCFPLLRYQFNKKNKNSRTCFSNSIDSITFQRDARRDGASGRSRFAFQLMAVEVLRAKERRHQRANINSHDQNRRSGFDPESHRIFACPKKLMKLKNF